MQDGGSLYGVVPKVVWNTLTPADEHNRVTVGINCLLIKANGKNILVDTGVGNKHPLKRKNAFAMKAGRLVSDLRAQKLGVDDIDIVALSHLHFDQAGGCTRTGYSDNPVPTFPKATYLVQKGGWNEATNLSERIRAAYVEDDYLPLQESRQLELLDGDTEIVPNVWLRVTGGHTEGHQMVFIDTDDQKVAYLGDLLPTHHHLPPNHITAWDVQPLESLKQKRRLITQAEKERWLLIFSHGVSLKGGYLAKRDGKLELEPQKL